MLGQIFKFGRIWSRGFGVFGIWACMRYPRFSAPPSGETVHRRQTCFGRAKKVCISSITMPNLVGFGYRAPQRGEMFNVFFCFFRFFVAVSICLLRFWMTKSAISQLTCWSTETILLSSGPSHPTGRTGPGPELTSLRELPNSPNCVMTIINHDADKLHRRTIIL